MSTDLLRFQDDGDDEFVVRVIDVRPPLGGPNRRVCEIENLSREGDAPIWLNAEQADQVAAALLAFAREG